MYEQSLKLRLRRVEAKQFLPLTYAAITIVASTCLYWNAKLILAGWYESRQDLPSVLKAVTLVPGNEAYLRRAAQLTDEREGDGTAYYMRAVHADPYSSYDWMQLALHAERSGRAEQARHYLLTAAHYDHLFEPRWTLANYYFRTGNVAETLYWIRQSLAIAEADFTTIFRLCWLTSDDPGLILSSAIPNRPMILVRYLRFLCVTNRWGDTGAVVKKLVAIGGAKETPVLADYCDAAIAAGHRTEAIAAFSGCSHR